MEAPQRPLPGEWFVKCDLGDIQDVKAAIEKIKQVTDRIHILICNAGDFSLYLSISTESLHIDLPPLNEAISVQNDNKRSS